MRRYAAAAAAAAAMLAAPAAGSAHHTTPVEKVTTIKRVYPDLYRRELARERPSWAHLRRMARTRYHDDHPIAAAIAHPTPAGNRFLARFEFPGHEYFCAAEIIEGETAGTWRHDIAYGMRYGEGLIDSGLAYGLGQAKPGTKMLRYGADAASNPATQLRWFRAYAQARYGSVCGAAAHWTPRGSW